jgi:sortase A
MKSKIIAFGFVGSILLILCAGIALFTGVIGWASFKPADEKRPVKISLLAPLPTPGVPNNSALPQPSQAAAPQAAVPEAAPVEHIAEPVEPALPAPVEAVPAAADLEVEQALGFALPAGSVNSVTQEGVATRLMIPKLGLDAPVTIAPIRNQTWEVDQLGQYVGHLEGTARPGTNSNIVLAGHITLAETNGGPGPFYQLSSLTTGDVIIVYEGETSYEYIVDALQTVDRTAVDVTFPTSTPQITLITCTQWDQNEGRYIERLVVTGRLNQS